MAGAWYSLVGGTLHQPVTPDLVLFSCSSSTASYPSKRLAREIAQDFNPDLHFQSSSTVAANSFLVVTETQHDFERAFRAMGMADATNRAAQCRIWLEGALARR